MKPTKLLVIGLTLVLTNGCANRASDPGQRAEQLATQVCELETTTNAAGESEYVYTKGTGHWSGNDDIASLKERLDDHEEKATLAMRASQLDGRWKELATNRADMATFVSAVIRVRTSGGSIDSLDGQAQYNIPLGRMDAICRALAADLNSR